jgi:hypothetical protein
MSIPAPDDHNVVGYAQTGDMRQAEYYLGLLDQQRECVEAGVATYRLSLAGRSEAGYFNQIRRLRRMVQRQEKELRELDRLIDALNDRLTRSR